MLLYPRWECFLLLLLFFYKVKVIAQSGLFRLKQIEFLELFLQQYIVVNLAILLQYCDSLLNRLQVFLSFISDWYTHCLWREFNLLLNFDPVLDVGQELRSLFENLVVQETNEVIVTNQIQIQKKFLEEPSEQKVQVFSIGRVVFILQDGTL